MAFGQPGEVVQVFAFFPAPSQYRHDGEGAQGHEGIDGQIQHHAGHAFGRDPGFGSDPSRHDQADQGIAGVRDARIGQHALHVGLHDGDEVPQDQGQDTHAQDEPAPVRFHAPEAFQHHPEERPEAGGFGRHGHERGYRGRRALIYVRGPHVERHGRHLEAEPHDHQHQGDENHRVVQAPGIDGRGDFDETRAARGAEDKRNAVEQETGRERAQNEILRR